MTDPIPGARSLAPELTDHVRQYLRHVPKQPRALEKLNGIVMNARVHYDDVGAHRFKTAVVAELAQVSIGTIYRYFEDRGTLLDALSEPQQSLAVPTAPEVPTSPPVPALTFVSPEPKSDLQDALDVIRNLSNRMVLQGAGKADLKTAGEAILRILSDRNI